MRYFLILAFALVISALISADVSAEPEVYMVEVSPDTVDNEEPGEDVALNADCSVCNGEGLTYFYWNSSIDGVLSEGSSSHNKVLSSTLFSVGNHTVTFQVKDNNSAWSSVDDLSSVTLTVSGRDGGGGDTISVNFQIEPLTINLGNEANFRACSAMQPQPQPCVEDDPEADLDFLWQVDWNNQGDLSYIGDSETVSTANLQEGTHTVKLTITYNGDSANSTQEMIVLPPVPRAVIDFLDGGSVKEGENFTIGASCLDNNGQDIDCEYYWEIWDNDGNPDLQFEMSSGYLNSTFPVHSFINLTTSMGSYEFLLKVKALDSGIFSLYTSIIVNVLPPNEFPSSSISISPDAVGGSFTPEYYQYSTLTFISTSSDPDGNLVKYEWYIDNEFISDQSQFSYLFDATNTYFVKLKVQDDNGAWSSRVSTGFKIITNTAPSVDFTYSSVGYSYTFNSTASDPEGLIYSYEWSINGAIYSNEENITWNASESGTYIISLLVMDEGGLNATISKDIEVVFSEVKNFIVFRSPKVIDIGDNFEMDFSNTTGEVDYFSIKVLYPDGTSADYKHKDRLVNFSITFDKAGTYPINVIVIWKDGEDRGMDDFYGPTVEVGMDGEDGVETIEEGLSDSAGDIPSVSLLVTSLLVSLIAGRKRQR